MTIHFDLQKILLQLFGLEIPISMVSETPPPSAITQIVYVEHVGCGDEWSGYTYAYDVILENFRRPDNNRRLVFKVEYAIHDLSGQIDVWKGNATNIKVRERDLFLGLLDVKNMGLYPSNSLTTDVYINRKKMKLLNKDG